MYIVRQRQTGFEIDEFSNLSEAVEKLQAFESEDLKDGVFEPDFYEIVDNKGNIY